MIVAYTDLPDDVGGPRPLLDVVLADMDELRYPALVDSGAVNTLLPRWLADAAGLDLSGAEARALGVAGGVTQAAQVTTRLAAAGHSWEWDVAFCDPWPYSWGLLGQRSFFRHFTVTFRAADLEFEVQPVES